jgi:hypothetical protein
MKKALLIVFLCLTVGVSWSNDPPCRDCPQEAITNTWNDPIQKVTVFPNPATDFIALANDEGVEEIIIYNMVGLPMKRFKTSKGSKYRIADLLPGMYLIQILDGNQNIVMTQRITKK